MADLPIRLTCADYARVMPLAVGNVKPDGIALTMVLGREGSWPMRAEMLRRAAGDPTVHGGESSMAGHLRRIDQGDRSLVALPVFPLRNFTARDLYVRKDGAVTNAGGSARQACRDVRLGRQRLDLVPALPALHRCAARGTALDHWRGG